MSYLRPPPKRRPKRLPRRKPIKVIPSGIGDEGIVGNWLMYYLKGRDHLHDLSPNNNHGILKTSDTTLPQWVDGRYGWALKFDGSDDYVEVPSDASHTFGDEDFTISAWIKTSVGTGNYTIVAQAEGGLTGSADHRYLLRVQNGTLRLEIDDNVTASYVDGTVTVNDGEWHYVVGVRDTTNDELRVYVDGSLDNTDTDDTGSLSTADGILALGVLPLPTAYFQGKINIARLYTQVRSATSINKRFQRTRGIFGV